MGLEESYNIVLGSSYVKSLYIDEASFLPFDKKTKWIRVSEPEPYEP